jgi:hypothetical protein
MTLQPAGNPDLPEGTYWGEYTGVKIRDGDDQQRVAVELTAEHDGKQISARFDAPAKVSVYDKNQEVTSNNSKLGNELKELGFLEIVDEAVGADGTLVNGENRFVVTEEEDKQKLRDAIQIVFRGKKFQFEVNEEGYISSFLGFRETENSLNQGQQEPRAEQV